MLKRMAAGAMAASGFLGITLAIFFAAPASANGCTQIGYEAGPWGPGRTVVCPGGATPPDGACNGWYWMHKDQYEFDPTVCYH